MEGTLENKMDQKNKEKNSMKILVKLLDESLFIPKLLIKSKDIIYPKCYESFRIKMKKL